MNKAYDEIGEAFSNGTLDGTIVQMNAANGAFSFAPFHNVSAEVERKAKEALAGLEDGSITVPTV